MSHWWDDRDPMEMQPLWPPGGRVNRWTGKPTNRPPVIPGEACGEECETHAAKLVNDCAFCGAPVCCPACCEEARDGQPGGGS